MPGRSDDERRADARIRAAREAVRHALAQGFELDAKIVEISQRLTTAERRKASPPDAC